MAHKAPLLLFAGLLWASIYLLSRCPVSPDEDVCVAGSDSGGSGSPDSFTFRNTGSAATFFLVVDSFDSDPFAYDLRWTITP